jgi:predicted transcriptional regulator of viral defense system
MDSNLRTLGPLEAKVVLSFREQGRSHVRVADVRSLVSSDISARKVIRNLLKKGWFSRIVGGHYMLQPPEYGPENLGENNALALAAAAVEPSYIGWWSAAAYHGFTTQKPMTVFVAVQRQTPTRTIEGTEARFVSIARRKFFGHENYTVYGRPVSISTPVKTLIDCIDRPDLAGGPVELARITHRAMAKINPHDLLPAATAMKSRALLQRLGFLTDLVGTPLPDDVRKAIRDAIPHTYRSHFGRDERREGDIGYVADWGIFVNARRDDLLAEVPRVLQPEQTRSC